LQKSSNQIQSKSEKKGKGKKKKNLKKRWGSILAQANIQPMAHPRLFPEGVRQPLLSR
jgi:hypothetical protein